jgi:5-methylcytosine-specific restriction endonuclease McrA
MPFKDKRKHKEWCKNWYRKKRLALVQLLGGKCAVCGSSSNLELHHIKPIENKSRPNNSKVWDASNIELLCSLHHSHTDSYHRLCRRKRIPQRVEV